MKEFDLSEPLFKKPHVCQNITDKYISQGAFTNSKRRSSFIDGVYPTHLDRGTQEYVVDIKGSRYIDFICGLGTNLFGYTNPQIIRAMQTAITRGTSLSLGTTTENLFAMKLINKFPHIEKMKILKSGSEGCSAAIKIARAFTGKSLVLSDGYHGWHDDFVSMTPPGYGVPDRDWIKPINQKTIDEYEYRNGFSHVAAIIVEPVILDWSDERKVYLERLRFICDQHDALLIFDETITAYRFPQYSVAKYWSIKPDITVQGKALANGMPISVVGGRKEVMEGDFFVSSTYAGETITLSSAIECIGLISDEYNPERLWENGSEFIDRMNDSLKNIAIEFTGYPTRGSYAGNKVVLALFFQEMLKAGVMFHPKSWFYNKHLHTHIDDLVDLASKIATKISRGSVRLEGELPIEPFKKG